jgi:hypothetical protein
LPISNNQGSKENKQKNIRKSWKISSHHSTGSQVTTIHHESTINSPQKTPPKNTTKKHIFFPHPLKKANKNNKKSPGNRRDFFLAKI